MNITDTEFLLSRRNNQDMARFNATIDEAGRRLLALKQKLEAAQEELKATKKELKATKDALDVSEADNFVLRARLAKAERH